MEIVVSEKQWFLSHFFFEKKLKKSHECSMLVTAKDCKRKHKSFKFGSTGTVDSKNIALHLTCHIILYL